MKSLITTFCIAALCWVAVPGSAYSQDDTISAEDFDAAVAAAVADAIEGLAKQEDLSGFEGRIGALETSAEAAVAEATAGMYTQAQYDAATDGLYTQDQYDAAVDTTSCGTTIADVLDEGDYSAEHKDYEVQDVYRSMVFYSSLMQYK